ncbi:MAG: hypothetical protein SFU84_06740 [Gemmatimonadales bacterium]|nr:hypothetical protein [Gemmatimonadales bacterium]
MHVHESMTLRHFADRGEAFAHLFRQAGESPRLLAWDDAVGCPMATALAALEWTSAVGILREDDAVHAARLTTETSAAVIERKHEGRRQYLYLGPRLDAPAMDVFEGTVVIDEPGVKVVEFAQRAHALAHFLRATAGHGALVSLLSRRAPEVRHLRRGLTPILAQLGAPHALVGGWFAATSAGCLFLEDGAGAGFRYVEVAVES